MNLNKLYKKDSKSKIRQWQISTGKDSGGYYYEVSFGEIDGALQVSKTYVTSGKNIGRSNETTAKEQCKLEAEALHKKQIERKGYSETIPDSVPLKPMLAKKFQDEISKVEYPAIIQSKLDGSRCLARITKSGVELISRQSTKFLGLEHLEKSLHSLYKKYGEIILDGELYSKEISFQEIMSLVRKSKNLSEDSKKIEYWVYDIVNTEMTYHERHNLYSYLIQGLVYVRETPSFIVKNEDMLLAKHKKFIAAGYEGSMVRNLNSLYKINSRSSDLLKLKEFMDEEFKIIGWKTGKGKFANIPTFIMETSEGATFEGVPVGTQEDREAYLKNAKNYIGKMATVRFFEYTTSDKKVPRFPVIYDLDRKE